MVDLVWGSSSNPETNKILKEWAEQIIWPNGRNFAGDTVTMGVVDGENLIGVIVFHNYDRDAKIIEYSGASNTPNWLQGKSLLAMFAYPFEELGCQMVITRNSEHNTRLHRQLTAYGHTSHRIERIRGVNEAEFVWTLTKEQWASNKFMKRLERLQNGQ